MAELLVMAVSKVNAESRIRDARSYKRGDVVIVKTDGWPWGPEERKPPFLIVKVPGAAAEDFADMEVAEPGEPKVQPLLQRRAIKFDLDQYEADLAARVVVETLTGAQALALKQVKPPLDDSGVLVGEKG